MSLIDPTPDRVLLFLPEGLHSALAARCAPGQTVDDLVEGLLATDHLNKALRRLRDASSGRRDA